ncbi:MAG: trypsin-like peptidase domain-containing protein [Pseudomonadales bacterium]
MRAFFSYITWPVICGVLLGLLILQILNNRNPTQITLPSFAPAVERASPAVVNIFTSKTVRDRRWPASPLQKFFRQDRRERVESSLGSGVIMRSEGYVVTNFHVVSGADEILVLLANGQITEAELVGIDRESDLALLKIPLQDLPAIQNADVKSLRVGDLVLAIGNPYGFGHSVTQGIVSATGRYGLQLMTYENLIQTDAAINPGSSGGALVDSQGRFLGIITANYSTGSGGSDGIGLAIPADNVGMVVDDLIQHGYVMRGWLGIEVEQTVNGVLLTGTNPQGPADIAGLRAGDLLTAINKQSVVDPIQAMNIIAAQEPGSEIEIAIQRGESKSKVIASIGLRSPR